MQPGARSFSWMEGQRLKAARAHWGSPRSTAYHSCFAAESAVKECFCRQSMDKRVVSRLLSVVKERCVCGWQGALMLLGGIETDVPPHTVGSPRKAPPFSAKRYQIMQCRTLAPI